MQTRTVPQLYTEKARRLFFCKLRVCEHGERAGKLLAYLPPPIVITLHRKFKRTDMQYSSHT